MVIFEEKRYFAVLDTETNWNNAVMSIGIVIADSYSFEHITTKYYILTPEYKEGGMFSSALEIKNYEVYMKNTRTKVISDIIETLRIHNIDSIFAYNAKFDYNHLPELKEYKWFDIMRVAAYKQYNKAIPKCSKCCGTGKLKRNYGVEPIMRLLSDSDYCEEHNALCDAVDELKIMKLLEHSLDGYDHAQINAVNERDLRKKRKSDYESYCKGKNGKNTKTSEVIRYSIGDKVIHSDFGIGTITDVKIITKYSYVIDVTFESYGDMRFQMPYYEESIRKSNDS